MAGPWGDWIKWDGKGRPRDDETILYETRDGACDIAHARRLSWDDWDDECVARYKLLAYQPTTTMPAISHEVIIDHEAMEKVAGWGTF